MVAKEKEEEEVEEIHESFVSEAKKERICNLEDFNRTFILGKGGFGKVFLSQDPFTDKYFALKCVRKDRVVKTRQQEHMVNEKLLMERLNSTFLVKLWKTYQDKHYVYFLLDACMGGDLFTYLRRKKHFTDSAGMFYAACVIEGFIAMHKQNMCYRDLKPENLVLDHKGYVKICDFGFAKVVRDKTFTMCGTPDYLSPEIIAGIGHNQSVDLWTLGVLIYEMLCGVTPFYDRNTQNIYKNIVKKAPHLPRYLSHGAKEIVTGLLTKKPHRRLGMGHGGTRALRCHPWYRKFDWRALKKHTMPAPMDPKLKSDHDTSMFKKRNYPEEPAFQEVDGAWAACFGEF